MGSYLCRCDYHNDTDTDHIPVAAKADLQRYDAGRGKRIGARNKYKSEEWQMLHAKYYAELEKYNALIERKNQKSRFYNGILDRYEYPVLTREHIPLTWKYDLNPETNPFFMERLGVNAVMNSGAIELNGKIYLVVRIEGNDRKSFFGVAERDKGIDGFRFWDYPIQLPDTCKEETNVYDMRLTKHEDGFIYGVFCSESKDTQSSDLSAAVPAAALDSVFVTILNMRLLMRKLLQANVCIIPLRNPRTVREQFRLRQKKAGFILRMG